MLANKNTVLRDLFFSVATHQIDQDPQRVCQTTSSLRLVRVTGSRAHALFQLLPLALSTRYTAMKPLHAVKRTLVLENIGVLVMVLTWPQLA